MDYKNIEQLIKTVSDSQLTSFEIETEGIMIKMEKKEKQIVVEKMTSYVAPVEKVTGDSLNTENIAVNGLPLEKQDNNMAITIENAAKVMLEENLVIVKSPIVGTMYTSPGSDSNNFVKVGSKINKGDTLCILEAMKLMNEIESEVDGEVVEVLVSNGDMVEYGQPLFKILKK
ncbi:acetyl-CoA carboxylase biotin carboxyl carrier protein [Clostridium sp.]|uniref:acetyl-CoA carboxylase biotin carboxyl carrier protein n=1 Tax=Clostridium sp. TaxID=1506 RepID=UPI001A5C15CD|nr:acetyl-CoA carboxylase biotin carboxyl carrier protein [Clostridium sp.]MBK5240881.1 acetyl-CoA carboxylase biotin carboxyl carrier protein [Clostridium sp.]